MNKFNVLDELYNRGLIFNINNFINLRKIIFNKNISLYCGFDPTADSLHVGHLLPLLCLNWFAKYGHNIYVVIGYATSLIGDPSFKNHERKNNLLDNINFWGRKIEYQINMLFENNNIKSPIILNNYNWFKKINVISFLRDIGKYFSINNMINKKFVKKRIDTVENGISFTEFSYNLLQSYDFFQLYKKHKIILQIGGSDQWGNIASGIHLINKLYNKEVFGLTVPLLLQSNGMKFGKTEQEQTIWLSSSKTSPYAFYQFWINIKDDQFIKYLKFFTFLNICDIDDIQKFNKNMYSIKYLLADHITAFVHGEKELRSVKRITNSLFNGNINDLMESDFLQLKKDGISFMYIYGTEDLKQVLVNAKLCSSRSEAHKLILSHAIKINSRKELNPNYKFFFSDKLFGKFTLISKGKKKYFLLCW